jgi:hexosaminidase
MTVTFSTQKGMQLPAPASIPIAGSLLKLASSWTSASADKASIYALTLTNHSLHSLADFSLCISGPGRVDSKARIEGAEITSRLSNHLELKPPRGLVLKSKESWVVKFHGIRNRFQHWSEGTTGAYLVFAGGRIQSLAVESALLVGNNEAHLRGAKNYPLVPDEKTPVSIIPWPNQIEISAFTQVPQGLDFCPTDEIAKSACTTFSNLCTNLFPAEEINRSAAEGGSCVECHCENGMADEHYKINFSATGISLKAATETGFLYGMITLGQMLRGAKLHPTQFFFPAAGEITDSPIMSFRGCHLDVARQFYTSAEVAQFLNVLAWNKMNRFHWHLSDDEAWRVEIDAYPELTSIAAWRGHGLPIPPLLGSGPAKFGGYYTKIAIRELVALAASFGISVIPEIDVPGHCYCVLKALPQLRDPDEVGSYSSIQVFPNNCLNPARPETYRFLETVFGELIELFPSKTIHIGADEVPLAAWSGSPLALEKLKALGGEALAESHAKLNGITSNLHGADRIEGTGTAILQAEFLSHVQKFLASRGCVTGGWEEASHGHVIGKEESYLVGWRDVAASGQLAGEGYDIVVCPGQHYYLDMAQGQEWSEPGAWWAGYSSPQSTYNFDPTENWTTKQRKHFLGIQACIWSESMTDRAVFDRLVFPRLSAVAETAWTNKSAKSFERFIGCVDLMPLVFGHRER